MKKKQTKTKIKAWAFMADTNNGKYKYFIKDSGNWADICFKKPKARPNPFIYSREAKLTWKPTEIIITY